MAGGRKQKKKTVFATPDSTTPTLDNDELDDDLFSQLDLREKAVTEETQIVELPKTSQMGSKGRFNARQARKAAALEQLQPLTDPKTDARLEREAREEEKHINQLCDELSLQVHEIAPDGHCLFTAIADQLALLGILSPSQANYAVVRQTASQYMLSHPDDFLPFLPLPSGDGGLASPEAFEAYCAAVRDTAEWGGEPEIRALCHAYGLPIHVIQGGQPRIVVHDPHDAPVHEVAEKDKRVMRISYHRKMYGLGEHYNSLRPRSTLSQLSQKVHALLSVR